MEDSKLMTTLNKKGTLDPGNWDDGENIGQRVLNEMMEYLKNISSKPENNKAVELSKEKLQRGLYCN